MRRLIPIVLGVCFVTLLSGCATIGNSFDSTAVDKLEVGSTTESQAIVLLGSSPTHRQTRLMNRPNPTTWVKGDYFLGWRHAQGNAFGKAHGQSLLLMFDKNKTLKELIAHASTNMK